MIGLNFRFQATCREREQEKEYVGKRQENQGQDRQK